MKLTTAPLRLCVILIIATIAVLSRAADSPNIVLIFIDDMGYGDIGPFGNTVNQTPNLDRMAKEGLVLRQFYVSNTACTPSRSALLTGTYAHRIGMDGSVVFPGEKRGLHPNEITIAELLKTKGYVTGCFGKWHLGDQPPFLPPAQGFDEYFGIPYSNDMWPGNKRGNPVTNRGPYTPLPVVRQNKAVAYVSDGADQSLLCEAVTDEAITFIRKHKNEPFFCYLPHAYVHNPRFARPEILKRAQGNVNRANVEEVDDSVGRVLDTLRELSLDKKTLVIFTSDNGGAGGMSMGPLRGGKGGPKYEGHMREPTISWWPGTIPAGRVTDEIMASIDVLPTLARLAGADVPRDRVIDGDDALDVLLGKPGAKSPHEILYYENDGIRRGKWKLVVGAKRKPELYDLDADVGETTNLASKHPELVEELNVLLTKHADRIAADQRPAGMVENARPIISTPGDLPKLRTYMGIPDFEVAAPSPPPKKKSIKKNRAVRKPSSGTLPDVLFIAIDDMNDWTTLFDPKNPIKTPNLERLAMRGCFFTRAYCAAPGCNPSRTAILTGLRPSTSGVYGNRDPWKTLLPNVVTLPQHFKQNGYAAMGGGKIFHHGGTGTDRADNPSFDTFYKLQIHANKPPVNYNGYVRGRDHGGLARPSYDWGAHDVPKQTDEYTVEYVNNVMATHPKIEPLFLAAGIFRPHLPFWAPSKTFARYPFDKLRMVPMPEGDLDDVPPIGVGMAHTERFIWDNTTKKPENHPGSLKKMVQSYQAASDYADEMVGRLLDQLDKTGRSKNTIVVLWADHGYHLGDKTACVKFTLWEKANHVPFIIVAPGVTKPGTRCDRPVSLVDIYPTLVELAGLPKKKDLDGLSLVPLLKNPEATWERPALMTQMRGNHAVRSDRWRYIRYNDGTEELYDHAKDPWEHTNLAADPALASIKEEHKKWIPKNEGPAKPAAPPKPKGKPSPKRVAPFKPAPYEPQPGDILVADFEGKTYSEWTVTGEAFGKRPAVGNVTPNNKVTGYLGRGLVNSFLSGDKTTGTLTSPDFKIERKYLHFLIGGGNHTGKTCIDLVVGGKPVRTATGPAKKDTNQFEVMDWHTWNIEEFAGKKAHIRITDQHSGGWGHINIDQIYQSNQAINNAKAEKITTRDHLTIADLKKTPLPIGWQVEGYAFGARTPGPWRQRAAKTTANQQQYQTGELTSPEFTIERDYIVIKMDGVNHPTKCCVALLVDGEDVRRIRTVPAHRGQSAMDVRPWKGKPARIQIRDAHHNGWLNVEHILQTDQTQPGVPIQTALPDWQATTFETVIDKPYLMLPVNGPDAPLQEVVIEIDDRQALKVDLPLAMHDDDSSNPFNDLPTYDLTNDQGKKLKITYHQTADSRTSKLIRLTEDLGPFPEDDNYPAFQIGCKFGRLNDPNGLVYHQGIYHLFHQYWFGPRAKFWSHYASDDLIHWEERPIALFHDETGSMHSGSATVDLKNTAGFQKGDTPAIVAAFTGSRGMGGNDKIQVQGIAYSTDGGRTFRKYAGNPIIGLDHLKTMSSDHSRDPKVFWFSPTRGMDPTAEDGHWVMILFEGESHSIFTSDDLKNWKWTSKIVGFHECPELFPLATDGNPDDIRWIMYGANGAYHIGQFDGRQFTPETAEKIPYNFGKRHYAAQTFSNMPGKPPRRVQVGWQGSIISFPVELRLYTTPLGRRVCSLPIEEVEKLYTKTITLDGTTLAPGARNPLTGCEGGLYDIDLKTDVSGINEVILSIRGKRARFDVPGSTLHFEGKKVTLPMEDDRFRLRVLVDNRSINLFAGKRGLFYLPFHFNALPSKSLNLEVTGKPLTFDLLRVHHLKRIWN